MKVNKKILNLILIGVASITLVACSSQESETVDSGKAKTTEQTQQNNTKESTKKEDIVLMDDNVIKAVVTEKVKGTFGVGYRLSIQNKSANKIIVQTRDTSVNGTMEEPIFSADIMPGKTANETIEFSNIKNMDELKNLEGKLLVMDENFQEIQSYDLNIK